MQHNKLKYDISNTESDIDLLDSRLIWVKIDNEKIQSDIRNISSDENVKLVVEIENLRMKSMVIIIIIYYNMYKINHCM